MAWVLVVWCSWLGCWSSVVLVSLVLVACYSWHGASGVVLAACWWRCYSGDMVLVVWCLWCGAGGMVLNGVLLVHGIVLMACWWWCGADGVLLVS